MRFRAGRTTGGEQRLVQLPGEEGSNPLLLRTGRQHRAPVSGVARILLPALPDAELPEFEGLGHMGPITHPAAVNEAIARFLGRASLR